MTAQPNRLPSGGRIDRSKVALMTYGRRQLLAHPGDTLASALLANGETIVARSFKYHRPRGVMTAGSEESNALVRLRDGGQAEPNTQATMIEAYDGLTAAPQNAWPSVKFDVGAVNQLLAPFLGAGFYYKTFMGPVIGPLKGTRFWMFCEHFIRRAAGMGRARHVADPDAYEKVNAHCDVLVVGGGPAGLAAAHAAGRAGAEVILVDEDFALGGSLLDEPAAGACDAWLADVVGALEGMANVRILTRTTAFGAYDNDVYGLVERCWDHVPQPPDGQPRQRYWQVRSKQAVLACGAIERPLVFAGNDKPGVMLARALRSYVNRYAVLPGREIVIVGNNDSAYATAIDAAHAGGRVRLVDVRREPQAALADRARDAGVALITGMAVREARGRGGVTSVNVGAVDGGGRVRQTVQALDCDVLAVAGGWSPVLHLWSQRGGRPVYDGERDCFVPDADGPATVHCAGAAAGRAALTEVIADGWQAGATASQQCGHGGPDGTPPDAPTAATAFDWTKAPGKVRIITDHRGKARGKAFVDLQHDVTLSDIDLAYREGFVSVEHLKRYTTTGMATDQGKTSNVNALARMAELRGLDLTAVGTTTFRPPFTPVAIGAIVGRDHGHHFVPTRLTPMHDWHLANGAVMTDAGAWQRPQYYPEGTEDIDAAYRREADHVRAHVGIVDVSTLGKIAVQGPDAAEFLNRVYVNGWKTLAVGRLRYGIMLREDGFVMDDGATARLGEFDYLMSTTTANAGPVLAFLEHLLQTAWRDLRVHVTSVTDQWAAIAVAGPKSRALLTAVMPGADLSAAALPNNHFVHGEIAGVAVRVHRMSYSGELAYEVYAGSGHGLTVWEALVAAGGPFELKVYGTEAMGTLRIEKGHVAGPEIDGRTTLGDLALAKFASTKKPFVGSVLSQRAALVAPNRHALIGLEIDGEVGARAGMLLFARGRPSEGHGEGLVTSTTYSPALGKYIALGLLTGGSGRAGEIVNCVDFVGDRTVEAKVVSHHFFDPEGKRQNG